jgi:hypothetical protein
MIIQISNKEKADEEIKEIKDALSKRPDLKWMLIVDNDKDCDTNDVFKAKKVPVSKWKEYAKTNTATIDVIIFAESDEGEGIKKSISYAPAQSGTSGTNAVVFMLWAPNGDVFTNQYGEKVLEAQMYDGTTNISQSNDVEYVWYKYTGGKYSKIQSGKGNEGRCYSVNGSEVKNIQTYKCEAAYNGVIYTSCYTMEDKSDNYISEMLTTGGTTFKNKQGGTAVYVIVRSNGKEIDPFRNGHLPSTNAPTPVSEGEYWWKVDGGVQLMKSNEHLEWERVDQIPSDLQELNYTWSLMNKDGLADETFNNNDDKTYGKTYGKVIYLTAAQITSVGTLQCDVTINEDATGNPAGVLYMHDQSSYAVTDNGDGNVVIDPDASTTATDDGEGNVTIS